MKLDQRAERAGRINFHFNNSAQAIPDINSLRSPLPPRAQGEDAAGRKGDGRATLRAPARGVRGVCRNYPRYPFKWDRTSFLFSRRKERFFVNSGVNSASRVPCLFFDLNPLSDPARALELRPPRQMQTNARAGNRLSLGK